MAKHLALACLFAASIMAQQAEKRGPRFEVASVKQDLSMSGESSTSMDPGRITMRNVSLTQCIEFAFRVNDYSLLGPTWLDEARIDIDAKLPEGAQYDDIRSMLQALLAERFNLRTHRASQLQAGYTLTVGKNGPKVKASADDQIHGISSGGRKLIGNKVSMVELADMLARELSSPVRDMTSLTGVFDVRLAWAPSGTPAPPLKAEASDWTESKDLADLPSLAAAVQEQLGLVLRRAKVTNEVLVIDKIERVPTEN